MPVDGGRGVLWDAPGSVRPSDEPSQPHDAAPNAPPVARLGHDAWQLMFGGDRHVLGRTIPLDGKPVAVVGVLPRGFVGPMGSADVWVPLDLTPFLGHPIGERRLRMLRTGGPLGAGRPAGRRIPRSSP